MTPSKLPNWTHSARFYHIYPLGSCGAPYHLQNTHPQPRINQIYDWIEHLKSLKVNAIWLGPVFASSSHGYDTIDYFHLDPRLGSNHDLRDLIRTLHQNGIRVVLDAVLNHVGRDFWAFRDLRQQRQRSRYAHWFQRLSFRQGNRLGDPFSYQSWKGHRDLVKLNLNQPDVKAHLFEAVKFWIDYLQIDGLRLDAADCLNLKFMQQLSTHCRRLKPDFWLMGEVVSGDYRRWIEKGKLHSVTNYELYDVLHRSHQHLNYNMLGDTLQRQFGPHGKYRGLQLYNFVDNHDSTRIATQLRRPALLYPLHILLYTLPGIPSIYYGSEWGQKGQKHRHSDADLRPAIAHPYFAHKDQPDLLKTISQLAEIHQHSHALQSGDWHLLSQTQTLLVYLRHSRQESLLILVHAGAQEHWMTLTVPWQQGSLHDLLAPGEIFAIHQGQIQISVHPYWGRILKWSK